MKPNHYHLSIAICCVALTCCIACANPGKLTTEPKTTGRAECDSLIIFFNRNASYPLIKDIRAANSKHRITAEIKALYSEARDQWNAEMSRFGKNYTRTLRSSLPQIPSSVKGANNMEGLANYQKFFVLITEAAQGEYPHGSNPDMFKIQNWTISADAAKSLDAIFRKFQNNGDCIGVDVARIRPLLKPQLLPERIEDCY